MRVKPARPLALLVLAALLAACPAGGPTSPVRPGGSAKPRVATPKPSPTGKARAPSTSPSPGVAARLARPAAGTTALRGRVTIEAGYALARGGTLLPGGAAVAAAGTRVDAASGRLLSDQGGLLLSDAGGNVIAQGGGGLAPDLGDGTLLAGGGLVSDGGGSLVSDGGGSLIGNNAAGYGLLAEGAPQAGTELPAAGMLVSVVSLTDRTYLPLGQDPAGKPVYAVWSNVAGEFELHVPADAPTNLLIVASAAGERDRRLALNVVVADRAAAAQVDELERLVTRYVRRAFTGKLIAMLRNPELATALTAAEASLTERARAEVVPFIAAVVDDARAAGLTADVDEARLAPTAQRVVDLVLADLDLATLTIDGQDVASWDGDQTTKVLDAYRRTLGDILAGGAAKLRGDPAFFSQTYLETVINAPRDELQATTPIGDWTGAIRTPGDVGEFLLAEYFGVVRANFAAPFRRMMTELYRALGATGVEPEVKASGAVNLIYGAGMQATVAVARRYTATPALQARARAIFAEAATAPPAGPAP